MRTPTDDDPEVTTEQAAALLGVPSGTIRSWKKRKEIVPCGFIPGRGREAPLYRLSELQALAGRPRGRPPTRRSEANNLIAGPA